jgi:hypothetical protein
MRVSFSYKKCDFWPRISGISGPDACRGGPDDDGLKKKMAIFGAIFTRSPEQTLQTLLASIEECRGKPPSITRCALE